MIDVVSGSKLAVLQPEDPAEERYTFDGWHKESECENLWDFATDRLAGNTTFYAKWTPVPVIGVSLNKTDEVDLYVGDSDTLSLPFLLSTLSTGM